MTIDKIKHYMDKGIFDYWSNIKDVNLAETAKNHIKHEIDSGILKDIKYIAEYNLLCLLTS